MEDLSKVGAGSRALNLFDNLLHVFGWTVYSTKTEGVYPNQKQRIRWTLRAKQCRGRLLPCSMKDDCKHDIDVTEVVNGIYEGAVKVGKIRLVSRFVLEGRTHWIPHAQVIEEGAAGAEQIQENVAGNTTITSDTAEDATIQKIGTNDWIKGISSTEPTHQFESILNRDFPLGQIVVTAVEPSIIQSYDLPHDLHKVACMPATLPFEQFMYGEYEVEVLVKTTSNPFQACLVLVAITPDPVGLSDSYFKSWKQLVQRPHAWIDVAGRTTARLLVPFEYRRTFVRNIHKGQNCAGVEGAKYVRLHIAVASKLRVSASNNKEFRVMPFIRFTKADFAGMAYKVPIAQGPYLKPVRDFLKIVKQVDAGLEHVQQIVDLDKPLNVTNVMQVVPAARMHFPAGKGFSDASTFRLNPAQTTTMTGRVANQVRHNTIQDIARQMGVVGVFQWTTNQALGERLFEMPLEPAWFSNRNPSDSDAVPIDIPSPVSSMGRMHQYWSGTYVVSLYFVATEFHNGTIVATIEIGRTSGDVDTCQPYASYYVLCDVGEKRRFDITIPYIFDTPWRRTACVPLTATVGFTEGASRNKYRTGLIQNTNSRLILRVANGLRGPESVSSEIECIVMVRAGEDWATLSPIQYNALLTNGESVDNFPSDRYQPVSARKGRLNVEPKTLGQRLDEDKLVKETRVQALEEQAKIQDDIAKKLKDRERSLRECQTAAAVARASKNEAVRRGFPSEFESIQMAALSEYMNHLQRYPQQPAYQARSWGKNDLLPAGAYIQGPNGLYQRDVYHKWFGVGGVAWNYVLQQGGFRPWYEVREVPATAQGEGESEYVNVAFKPGKMEPTLSLASSPDTSIWDILRRPVMIQSSVTVQEYQKGPDTNVYMIPLMPPQWTYIKNDLNYPNPFEALCKQSPHVALTSMFRWFRGSQRYTIVAHSDKVIYVTYIPHSGSRFVGNASILVGPNDIPAGKKADDTDANGRVNPPGCAGVATEMLVPSVNRTLSVEVPYYTENVWTPMNNGNLTANGPWRDKMDDNVGHLVIWSPYESKIDVWWAAGDDFRMCGFIGGVPQYEYRRYDTMVDDFPRAQVSLDCGEVQLWAPPRAQMFGVFEMAGEALKFATTAWTLRSAWKVEKMVPKATVAIDLISENLLASKALIGEAQQFLVDSHSASDRLVEALQNALAGVISGVDWSRNVVRAIIDIWVCWKVPDPTVLAGTVARWLIDCGLFAIFHTQDLIRIFQRMFKRIGSVAAQAEEVETYSLLVELGYLFLKAFGVVRTGSRSVIDKMMKCVVSASPLMHMSYAVRNLKVVVDFLRNLMAFVKELWLRYKGLGDRNNLIYVALSERNEVLENFISELHFFTIPTVLESLRTRPTIRIRFYILLQTSYTIQKMIMMHPELVGHGSLMASIAKLHKKAEEIYQDLASCPIRFEPFVICLEGETAIGKSWASHHIASQLMQSTPWSSCDEMIYVRTSGQEFWNGYTRQPVVLFDDMHNVDETQQHVNTMADLFALKSSAAFNPNMARLEEKDKRGNPALVFILTNTAFPHIPVAACRNAFYRRRDQVWRVKAVSQDHQADFSHLRFEKYSSSVPPSSQERPSLVGTSLTYEQFMNGLRKDWLEYYEKERKFVMMRWKALWESMKKPAEVDLLDLDPYMILNRHLVDVELKYNKETYFEDVAAVGSVLTSNLDITTLEHFYENSQAFNMVRSQGPEDDVAHMASSGVNWDAIWPEMVRIYGEIKTDEMLKAVKSGTPRKYYRADRYVWEDVLARMAAEGKLTGHLVTPMAAMGMYHRWSNEVLEQDPGDDEVLAAVQALKVVSDEIDDDISLPDVPTVRIKVKREDVLTVCLANPAAAGYLAQVGYHSALSAFGGLDLRQKKTLCKLGQLGKKDRNTWTIDDVSTLADGFAMQLKSGWLAMINQMSGFATGVCSKCGNWSDLMEYACPGKCGKVGCVARFCTDCVYRGVEHQGKRVPITTSRSKWARIFAKAFLYYARWNSWAGSVAWQALVHVVRNFSHVIEFAGYYAVYQGMMGLIIGDCTGVINLTLGVVTISTLSKLVPIDTSLITEIVQDMVVNICYYPEMWYQELRRWWLGPSGLVEAQSAVPFRIRSIGTRPVEFRASRIYEDRCHHCDLAIFSLDVEPGTPWVLLYPEVDIVSPRAGVDWHAGFWLVPHDGEVLQIPNGECTHETCPMKNAEFVEALILWYLDGTPYFRCLFTDGTRDPEVRRALPYQLWESTPRSGPWAKISEWVKSCAGTEWWSHLGGKVIESLTKWWKWMIGLVACLALLNRLLEWMRSISGGDPPGGPPGDGDGGVTPPTWEELKSQSPGHQKYNKTRRVQARKVKNVKPARNLNYNWREPYTQGALDNTYDIARKVMDNMVTVQVSSKGKIRTMTGLGLADHFIMFPAHYMAVLDDRDSDVVVVSLVDTQRNWTVKFEDSQCVLCSDVDLIFWTSPPQIPLFANIIKHFAPSEYYESHAINTHGFLLVGPSGPLSVPLIQGVRISERVQKQKVMGPAGMGSYDIVDVVKYNFAMDGACGSPVLRYSDKFPIIGVHVAGRGNGVNCEGFGVIITQEMIRAALPVAQMFEPASGNFGYLEDAKIELDADLQLQELGTVEGGVHQPTTTKIRPSAVATFLRYEPERVPVPLGPNEGIYATLDTTPLRAGVQWHGQLAKDFEQRIEDSIGSVLTQQCMGITPVVAQPRTLSIEQATMGLRDTQYYEALDLSTSSGYPWCTKGKEPSKKPWITYERDANGEVVKAEVHPEVRLVIEEKDAQRRKGIVPVTIFSDMMKDEKKKKSAVNTPGKTRIICMSPVDFTISVRMYFLHFMAAFMSYRITMPHAVGINPDSYEWTSLVDKLKAMNPEHVWTLDYKNFGPGFHIRAARAGYRAMIRWCKRWMQWTKEEEVAALSLMYELIQSKHLVTNLVYQQGGGSPSGSSATVIINTLVNWFYIFWAGEALLYQHWAKKVKMCTKIPVINVVAAEFWDWFADNVCFFAYGDDMIAASSPDIQEIFNAKTVSAFLAQYNITATDSSKGVEVVPYTDYSKFEFLKRGLLPHPTYKDRWLAPLPVHIIKDTAYYIEKTGCDLAATRENAAASLVLAYGRGPEFYAEWQDELNACLAQAGINPINVSWHNLDTMFHPVTGQGLANFPTNKFRLNPVAHNITDIEGFEEEYRQYVMKFMLEECNEIPTDVLLQVPPPSGSELRVGKVGVKGCQVYRPGDFNRWPVGKS